jgi:hypothetical protein
MVNCRRLYVAAWQAATDLASRHMNQRDTLDALFELVFRQAWGIRASVMGLSLYSPSPVTACCAQSDKALWRKRCHPASTRCVILCHPRAKVLVWTVQHHIQSDSCLPSFAAMPMSPAVFVTKFPLLYPSLHLLSKFVHLIRLVAGRMWQACCSYSHTTQCTMQPGVCARRFVRAAASAPKWCIACRGAITSLAHDH